jgi:hypothetical protein
VLCALAEAAVLDCRARVSAETRLNEEFDCGGVRALSVEDGALSSASRRADDSGVTLRELLNAARAELALSANVRSGLLLRLTDDDLRRFVTALDAPMRSVSSSTGDGMSELELFSELESLPLLPSSFLRNLRDTRSFEAIFFMEA